jgi:hypothetical protein
LLAIYPGARREPTHPASALNSSMPDAVSMAENVMSPP